MRPRRDGHEGKPEDNHVPGNHRSNMKLYYNEHIDRWVLDAHELHCGDQFQVRLDGEWTDQRIECDSQGWIVVPVGLRPQSMHKLDFKPYD